MLIKISKQLNRGVGIVNVLPLENGQTYGRPYVLAYLLPNLKYIDQFKYSPFAKNPDRCLRNPKVVNFGIIQDRCNGDKLVK